MQKNSNEPEIQTEILSDDQIHQWISARACGLATNKDLETLPSYGPSLRVIALCDSDEANPPAWKVRPFRAKKAIFESIIKYYELSMLFPVAIVDGDGISSEVRSNFHRIY